MPSYGQSHILAYHMVGDYQSKFIPAMSIHRFQKEIEYLHAHYEIIPLSDLVHKLNEKKNINRCIAITFDDGFADNYTIAYPALKRYDIPATIFLLPEHIEKNATPWFIQFRYAFENSKTEFLWIEINGSQYQLEMKNEGQRLAASNMIMASLKGCSNQERLEKLGELFELLGFGGDQGNTMLSWDNVREMCGNGISFGAHTVTHPVLSRLSKEKARQEIMGSKQVIESKTKEKDTTFAYPFGKEDDFNSETISVIRDGGFECAVTSCPGWTNHKSDPFRLNRGAPWELPFI